MKYIPQKGDLLELRGDQFWITEFDGRSGWMKPADKKLSIPDWIKNYVPELPKFIRKATEEEMSKLINETT